MKNIKILIVEDELIIAENLRYILNQYDYDFVDVAMDAPEAKQFFKKNNYDLVLMDINLGSQSTIDGIDLIKWLTQKYTFSFIYVTANADNKTIHKAKETEPAGYIVKPFINTSIYANVELALNKLKKEEFFTFANKGMQQQILLSDIAYIQADGSYININTSTKEQHFIRKSLSDINNLYPTTFIRIHKSILINKNYIQAYTSQSVKINDKKLSLGRTYKNLFLEQTKGISFF